MTSNQKSNSLPEWLVSRTDSENGSLPLLPPPLGGGFGGMVVIITREMELSSIIRTTSGFEYGFLDIIKRSIVFNCKEIISECATKVDLNL